MKDENAEEKYLLREGMQKLKLGCEREDEVSEDKTPEVVAETITHDAEKEKKKNKAKYLIFPISK